MNQQISRKHLVNIALMLLIIGNEIYNEAGLAEVLNILWIQVVILYVLVPLFFHSKKYLKFVLSIIGCLLLGVIILEVFIEGDAELALFFQIWTYTHELPILLWPTLFVVLAKVSADLLINQNNIIEMERERSKSEIKFLQSQLSPHVLFNNLNNIYSFALHQSKETPKLILKLADAMRYMLYETKEDKVALSKELEYVDNYVELQQIQLENRGELLYEKEGSTDGKTVAPMMLISFIENCFKHAAASSVDELKIIIQIEIKDNTVNLFTENSFSKKQADEEDQLEEGGIGLENAKRRLELLYPDKHELIVKELKNLYIVNLSIELD